MILSLLAPIAVHAAALPKAESGRSQIELAAGWRVHKGEVTGGELAATPDADWAPATLPHTINSGDGEDGGGFYRGAAWYRRWLTVAQRPAGRRAYLEFDGAAISADVYLNGRHLARHDGGFARFRVDMTDALQDGVNLIAVRTDNAKNPGAAPLGGDFTLFGGLYRTVRLVETPDIHIDMLDHGGPGLYGRVAALTDQAARIDGLARIRNDRTQPADVTVTLRALDAQGRTVASARTVATVAARTTAKARVPLTIASPHRWDGAHDPYLYRLVAEVGSGSGNVVDTVAVPLGLRTIAFDAQRGFLLNGRPYPLHGVAYFHPERPGSGTAVTDAEIDTDMRILGELGATGLRLVHYQHPQRVYDDADRMGMPVVTEIPLNGAIDHSPAFRANVEEQMRELIRQNSNHPSVILWGIGNEVYATEPEVAATLRAANQVAHAEDPSRPTFYAHCCQGDDDPKAMITDVIGFNRYMGWYSDEGAGIGAWADDYHKRFPNRAFAVSEYGAGASIRQQQIPPPAHNAPNSGWHPEQAQTAYHISNWTKLRDRPYLFGTFVWVAFDLASDGRREGDRAGINDKGLVTYDRAVRKDAYYWYQANWSAKPMLHLMDKRATERTSALVDVAAVSNAPAVTLTVNGARVATRPVTDHFARFEKVRLRPGANAIRIEAARSGTRLADEATWILSPTSSFGIEAQPVAAAKPKPKPKS